MPKQIMQCDCRQGELVKISETREKEHHDGWYSEDGNTIFYCCDKCGQIYRRDKIYPAGIDLDHKRPDFSVQVSGKTVYSSKKPEDDIVPYNGQLSRQEIEQFVGTIDGIFDDRDEEKILKQR